PAGAAGAAVPGAAGTGVRRGGQPAHGAADPRPGKELPREGGEAAVINTLGKLLVLVNLAVAVFLLGLAAMTYFHPIDWGRKNPRKAWMDVPPGKSGDRPPNEVVASELDKRMAALKKQADDRPRAEAHLESALRSRDPVQLTFAENHLEYVKDLERLEFSR